MEDPVRVSCPHCPPEDPLQHLLETTSFYDGVDSDDDQEEEEEKEDKLDVCRSCHRSKDQHPPPYGPWCNYDSERDASSSPPTSRHSPRIRGRFRIGNLQPLVDACLGTGSIGSAFVAHYRQQRPFRSSLEGGVFEQDVFNLVVKRIGEKSQDFFEDGRKSLDPTVAAFEEKITRLKHIHLVKVYSIVGGNKIVMERVANGNLLDFLHQDSVKRRMNCHNLLYVGFQTASAMTYLEKNAVVHRRLTARNILVGEISKCRRWIHVKITDYGIPYETAKSIQSLIPWMSPEELTSDAIASTTATILSSSSSSSSSSDCWSFGVVLHEIFTFGEAPYNGLNTVTLRKWIPQGYRMLQHPLVPTKIYSMMLECWHPAALQRPAFRQLELRLWRAFKEVAPDFLCHNCAGKDVVAGLETRNR